jgi:phage tail tube protein FII
MAKHGGKTVQYKVYYSETDKQGKEQLTFIEETTSVKRPDLSLASDTIKGSGLMGEIDLPTLLQFGSLTYEITFRRSNKQAAILFGQKTHALEIRWVHDVLDSANSKISLAANKDIIRAIPKSMSLGNLESNSANETTIVFEVVYLRNCYV